MTVRDLIALCVNLAHDAVVTVQTADTIDDEVTVTSAHLVHPFAGPDRVVLQTGRKVPA